MLRKLSVISLVLSISMLFGCSSDISGTITYGHAPLEGVTVLLSATVAETTTTTNAYGVYTFTGVVPGGYTVTPLSSSFAFNPESQFVSIASPGTSAINVDFVVSEVLVCFDDDGDGYGYPAHELCDHPELDCDDSDDTIHPWACEILEDGIDQNCDERDAFSWDRFKDNCDGTVTDNLSGFIWLQYATAFGAMNWGNANDAAATLDENDFEWLTDGSSEGNWRLPTKLELFPFPGGVGYDLFHDSGMLANWTSTSGADMGLGSWAYFRYNRTFWGELKANPMTWDWAYVWPLRDPIPDE